MSILYHTREALGGDALPLCQSRSLRLTRYARPDLKDEARKGYLSAIVSAKEQRSDDSLKSWNRWLTSIAKPEHTLHARLEARLLINMGGTVLENAGLQLDRFGTAYIPGSAVKACARRTALTALRQWCETGQKPSSADQDACAAIAAPFADDTPGELLITIFRIFGCTDLEWGTYQATGNDLAWACGEQWPGLRDAARAALNAAPGCDLAESKPVRRGTVAFLPAYPFIRPKTDLELDVLTSHHSDYYTGKRATATDDENPIPVYFPAVAAGTVYTFALLPVGQPGAGLLDLARIWLKTGLEVFGLGAKTAAGYGCFSDATPIVQAQLAKEAEAKLRAEQEAAQKAKAEAEALAKQARAAARAAMSPEQKADAELADRAADWGWMKAHLTKFAQHPPAIQAALLRWFLGPGRERWLNEIKPDAAKGRKPWSQIIGAIHAARKTHKIDLP